MITEYPLFGSPLYKELLQTFVYPVEDDFQDVIRPVPVAERVDVRRLRVVLFKQLLRLLALASPENTKWNVTPHLGVKGGGKVFVCCTLWHARPQAEGLQ